jgi:hypothetical protein
MIEARGIVALRRWIDAKLSTRLTQSCGGSAHLFVFLSPVRHFSPDMIHLGGVLSRQARATRHSWADMAHVGRALSRFLLSARHGAPDMIHVRRILSLRTSDARRDDGDGAMLEGWARR